MKKYQQKKSLFNIPYWKIQTINFKKKKKKLVELFKSYPEEKGIDFSTNRNSNRYGLVDPFASIMKQELKGFSKEIKKDFAITEIWSVSYDTGDYQTPHNHSSMGLSGILYLDLSSDSPSTTFIQPWHDYEIDSVPHYSDVLTTEGDIFICPSFVLHYSQPNKSKNTKRIVSWDMKILITKEQQQYNNEEKQENG